MNKINIFIINNNSIMDNFILKLNNEINIIINIYNLCNYKINNNINKINNIINIYDNINKINIIFKNINNCYKLITQFNNIFYNYKKKYEIKLFNCHITSKNLFNELFIYKNIVMDPNKNPDSYLNYIISIIDFQLMENLPM